MKRNYGMPYKYRDGIYILFAGPRKVIGFNQQIDKIISTFFRRNILTVMWRTVIMSVLCFNTL